MIYQGDHHKPQRFVFREGLTYEENMADKLPKVCRTSYLVGDPAVFRTTNAPMLSFDAYYTDPLGEGYKSTTRYRKCKIFYFLEDDDIKIYEPPQKNSGLTQGVIGGKGRYEKPDGGFYSIDDLNVGENLRINGRDFHLTGCDAFTRYFLTEMGYRVKAQEPSPPDPITQDRNEMDLKIPHKNTPDKKYRYVDFFKHHPRNLRFYGICEGWRGQFEKTKEVTLYYDLSYGTIKLVEGTKSEKDAQVLLKHTLVPKTHDPALAIGELGSPTVLNLGHDESKVLINGKYYQMHNPSAFLVDSNPAYDKLNDIKYYKDVDLKLGVLLQMFGFKIVLYDCDKFTKDYFCHAHDTELVPLPWPTKSAIHHTHTLIYPHQMVGSQEETICERDSFAPLKNHTNLLHYFQNSKYGYDSKELKFYARAVTEAPVEKYLKYIISYTIEDFTIKITALDLDAKKGDVREHMHVKRMKVVKPHSKYENTGLCFYQPSDMFVGNIIYVRGTPYELLEADEYTYDYLERHCEKYPFSNIRHLMAKLRDILMSKLSDFKKCLYESDPDRTGYTSYTVFKDALHAEIPQDQRNDFPEHAMKTLARYYAEEEYIGLLLADIVRKAQTELYRNKFHDFEDMKKAFRQHDFHGTEYVDADRAYYILRTTSVPLSRDILKSLVYKFPKTDDGKVNYTSLVDILDWVQNPAGYDKSGPQAIQINWERKETEKNLDKIKFMCFLNDIVTSYSN